MSDCFQPLRHKKWFHNVKGCCNIPLYYLVAWFSCVCTANLFDVTVFTVNAAKNASCAQAVRKLCDPKTRKHHKAIDLTCKLMLSRLEACVNTCAHLFRDKYYTPASKFLQAEQLMQTPT